MRCLQRNLTTIYYCLYQSDAPILDDEGYDTGETTSSYSEPIAVKVNVSPAAGRTAIEQFGNDIRYEKVIVTDDPNTPIDESAVLFVDKTPEFAADGTPLYDYQVRRVARSLNGASIAIGRVNVE